MTAAYSRLLSFVVVFSVGILVVPVMLQIVSRYSNLIPSYIWTEELARFLFIWTVMIGTIIGVRDAAHFDVDLLPRLGARGDAFMRIVAKLGVLTIAIVFVYGGIEFTQFAWNRTSELAELPLWLIHIAWPIAGVSWVIFLGEQFVDDLRVLFGKTISS
ncbi:TRAP transporter small permease [Bosea sp. AAP35]|uniref:TRAP transporter small permease n=1 Tax=Bosea sp. AAP35 TaxID=1523417 RepID=UPI001E4CFD8E|nr:TRAP transporter small permease [Bosea sp. AAP35]MCC5611114.1 TRAP transporter small permease [Nostoc sp. CHAB 5834]